MWNNMPNSVVNVSTVNAFKAWLDKFRSHQAVKFDFTADLTGKLIGNRSEKIIKQRKLKSNIIFIICFDNIDTDIEMFDTWVHVFLLSWVQLRLRAFPVSK